MKEHPEPDYLLKATPIEGAIDRGIDRLLPGGYCLLVNQLVTAVLIPWLPVSPWPPPYVERWENWVDRDEAAWYVLRSERVVVAPSNEEAIAHQVVHFKEWPDTPHNAFRLPLQQFEAVLADVDRIYEESDLGQCRLSDLGARPLAEFVRREFRRAAFKEYERRLLCLDP